MSQKPHDPEAQGELEVAFDCCGCTNVIVHSNLIRQILDGAANPSPAPDPITGDLEDSQYVQFSLTADPANNLYLDVDYEWNPNADPSPTGALTIFLKAADPDCDATVPVNKSIVPLGD